MLLLRTHALRRVLATRRHCNPSIRCNSSSSTSPNPASSEHPKVIFSGIQPTGIPHLGNYLGALKQWVKLQDEAAPDTTLLFSIVDLHAITIKQDPKALAKWKKEMLASLYAVGIKKERSIVFFQSAVPQHAELMWILSCNASMGYLSRMTQWKSKLALPDNASPLDPSPVSKAALKLGLFSYPVLQAADILLYQTTHVPVGEDQAQHLEFARELAVGFNHMFAPDAKSPLLVPPQTILSSAKRVMSLTTPTKKMSKSDPEPKSRILITDSNEVIHKKFKSALTDSIDGNAYDRESRPGVSNLIDIMRHMDEDITGSDKEWMKELEGLSKRSLKETAADRVNNGLKDVRGRYEEIMGRKDADEFLEEGARQGGEKARKLAQQTIGKVREALGIA
ncbi:tryptophanyl-tRNA synthetase-like protein [Pleomassaria siparia CBS 279.74]|uniref:Tryptophan--tRNA ligase, mitochondrial n=1 Tax=Pleomassaria siparia CBS 279.74 TaxID=1314801 RepID=A0A6G1KRI9_9PLEO|nr:tryptophanyl-tRNA synthetase-like protein [Pleomassaria siparia CBS 279.74]